MTGLMLRRVVIASLLALTLVGAIGVLGVVAQGPEPRARWGYLAATLSFLLSAAQLAPAVALASRLGRGFWGAPLRRMADLLALTGLVSAPLTILLLMQLPDWLGRPSIWSDWPGAPRVWDVVAAIGLALTGLALAWLTTLPDRHPRGFVGGMRQWQVVTSGLVVLGAFYTMLAVFVHLLLASDLVLSLVPGWHSAVMPAYHVVSGFEAAVALVFLAALVAPRPRLRPATIAATAKLLLALALLWFYLQWCELLTDWYGRTPDEQGVLALFMFGPGGGLFAVAVVCEFLAPVLMLIWERARTSAAMTALVAIFVLMGSYVDRIRLYVGAWSVATQRPEEHLPDTLAALPVPTLPEVAACVGALALVGLLMLIAVSRVSPVADWETRALDRLTRDRRLLRTRVSVVARPT